MPHPLLDLLLAAADGRFPPVDGAVEVMAPERSGHHAIVEFTGHAVVLTDRDRRELDDRGADGFGGVNQPDLLRWLAGPDGWVGSHDIVLVARGVAGGIPGGTLPARTDLDDHPRVIRSYEHRIGVRVFGNESGVVTLGFGLVGRLEMSVQLFSGVREPGAGRRLIALALALVDADQPVFAQVAPGNAASLRAFLACGFVPIGAETLLSPRGSDSWSAH